MKIQLTVSLPLPTARFLDHAAAAKLINGKSDFVNRLIKAWLADPMPILECLNCGTIFFFAVENTDAHDICCPGCMTSYPEAYEDVMEAYKDTRERVTAALEILKEG